MRCSQKTELAIVIIVLCIFISIGGGLLVYKFIPETADLHILGPGSSSLKITIRNVVVSRTVKDVRQAIRGSMAQKFKLKETVNFDIFAFCVQVNGIVKRLKDREILSSYLDKETMDITLVAPVIGANGVTYCKEPVEVTLKIGLPGIFPEGVLTIDQVNISRPVHRVREAIKNALREKIGEEYGSVADSYAFCIKRDGIITELNESENMTKYLEKGRKELQLEAPYLVVLKKKPGDTKGRDRKETQCTVTVI